MKGEVIRRHEYLKLYVSTKARNIFWLKNPLVFFIIVRVWNWSILPLRLASTSADLIPYHFRVGQTSYPLCQIQVSVPALQHVFITLLEAYIRLAPSCIIINDMYLFSESCTFFHLLFKLPLGKLGYHLEWLKLIRMNGHVAVTLPVMTSDLQWQLQFTLFCLLKVVLAVFKFFSYFFTESPV